MIQCSSLNDLNSTILNSYSIYFTVTPASPWTTMIGIMLRPPEVSKNSPDLYALVEQDGNPIMRLDLYAKEECSDFRDIIAVWKNWLIIAYCDCLYLVSLIDNTVHVHVLKGYFGSLEGLTDHLLVADARRLLCFSEEADLMWSVDLGIDGVIFAVDGDVIVGEAEVDPPGGWVPFRLALQSGKRLV